MTQLIEIFQPLYPYTMLLVFLFFAIRDDYKKNFKLKSKFLTFLIYFSIAIYVASFIANYSRVELFWLFWFVRDFLIFVLLLILWHFISRYLRIAFGAVILLGLYYQYHSTGKLFFVDFNKYEVAPYDNSEILLQLKDTASLEQLKTILQEYNPQISKTFDEVEVDKKDTAKNELEDYYSLDIDANYLRDMPKIVKKLNKSGIVEWVEKDKIFALDSFEYKHVDTTVRYKFLTGLNDKFIDKNWGYKYWNEKQLYRYLSANKGVKKARVFILDTGVEATHEDLKENYISLNPEYDYDMRGHGTHCAGIAGAITNNNKGVASVNLTNDFFTITGVKVLNDKGVGKQKTIIDGIILAANSGADVISMSLSIPVSAQREKAFNSAIKYANTRGCIVVVAAGNKYENAKFYAPARCENVITVAAVDEEMRKADFSNDVTEIAMKVCAPGVNIYSTYPNNSYKTLQGTSMATPYVAGLLGIMKSFNPSLTTKQAYEILNLTGLSTNNTPATGKFIQPLEAIKLLNNQEINREYKIKYFIEKLFVF